MFEKATRKRHTLQHDAPRLIKKPRQYVTDVRHAATWVLVLLSALLAFIVLLVAASVFQFGRIHLDSVSVYILLAVVGALATALVKLVRGP